MMVEPNTAACLLAVLLLGVAIYGVKKCQGTTLTAPCLWVAISAACLAVLAFVQINANDSLGLSVFRFAMAASTLIPVVAILGAKRPQDRGWQWVVLTLWLIVVWPALQLLANPAGPQVELFAAWKLFLVGLIAMGPLNYLATQHWFASLLVAAGQFILVGEFLGFAEKAPWHLPSAVGCFLLAASFVTIKSRTIAVNSPNDEQKTRWLSFRDAYGAFWGLRIMQRVNETAALRDWPVHLTWSGFESIDDNQQSKPTAIQIAEIEQTLDTLLRRFF